MFIRSRKHQQVPKLCCLKASSNINWPNNYKYLCTIFQLKSETSFSYMILFKIIVISKNMN